MNFKAAIWKAAGWGPVQCPFCKKERFRQGSISGSYVICECSKPNAENNKCDCGNELSFYPAINCYSCSECGDIGMGNKK